MALCWQGREAYSFHALNRYCYHVREQALVHASCMPAQLMPCLCCCVQVTIGGDLEQDYVTRNEGRCNAACMCLCLPSPVASTALSFVHKGRGLRRKMG